MITFNPWTASFEEAQAAQQEADGPEGAIYQWSAAQGILNAQADIAEPTGLDVLSMVAQCALRGLVMPDWLAKAFLARYRAVTQAYVDSWDHPAAFGRPYLKGVQVGSLRRRRSNRLTIALAISEFVKKNPTAPLDPEWERLGKLVHKSDKEAQKLLAEAIRIYGKPFDPKEIRKRMGWPPIPRKIQNFRGRKK